MVPDHHDVITQALNHSELDPPKDEFLRVIMSPHQIVMTYICI